MPRPGPMDGDDVLTRGEITRLVQRWSDGDEAAFQRLIELVYDDLRQIAHRHLRLGRGDHTIQTTALVHEAYLKLARQHGGAWPDRAHFFAFASRAMRHILVDYARRRRATKRGGGRVQVEFADELATPDTEARALDAEAAELLALDEALEMLARRSERMARVVECRFFAGLSVAETAEALDTSVRTVERDWTRARAYLQDALARDGIRSGGLAGSGGILR